MKRCVHSGWSAVVVGLLWAASSRGIAFAADPDPMALLVESKKASEKIKDFTAILTKREQIEGTVRETETVRIKFRQEPFSVYMHWFQDPHKDREVIYVDGKYEGKIVGHQPVGPLNFSRRAEPDSEEALKHSRRPITQAGFRNAMAAIVEVSELGKQRNELSLRYLGTDVFDGRPVHVIIRMLAAKRDDYPNYLGLFYIDKQLMLPTKISGYDWHDMLWGVYTYSDVKINVGLTDKDFDIANPDYDFPGILPFGKMKLSWPFEDKKDKKGKKDK